MPFHKLAPAELVLDRKDYRQFVQWMYVSCWHGQAHESFAMWKIYGQIREAILMQTTSDKLKDAFDRQYPNVLAYFDQVDYKDPAQAEQIAFPKIQRLSTRPADVPGGEWFPYMVFMYIKHITYQYEHEVRLVSLDAGYVNGGSNSKKGITLDILAVPHFIERVSVAPGVDEWFYQTVKETVARFGITCEVSRSTLEAPGEAS
jgi:hypothetical protein